MHPDTSSLLLPRHARRWPPRGQDAHHAGCLWPSRERLHAADMEQMHDRPGDLARKSLVSDVLGVGPRGRTQRGEACYCIGPLVVRANLPTSSPAVVRRMLRSAQNSGLVPDGLAPIARAAADRVARTLSGVCEVAHVGATRAY